MYTLTYIYTSLYQIKQSVLPSYAFVVECNWMQNFEINLLNKFSFS